MRVANGIRRTGLLCLSVLLLASAASEGQVSRETLSDGMVASIERLLTEKMSSERIPGLSIAIAIDGDIAWKAAYGFADLENYVPTTPLTVYRTASIGKPMTATAVMQLVESGDLDLDAPIQRYCPAFPRKRWPITTRHLLGHTSGIRHYGGANEEAELFNTVHYESVEGPLEIFAGDSLRFEPGTAYRYSTFGYDVLGCVIEGASGTRYLDYMEAHVFGPAGMEDTRDDDPTAVIPRRAEGYRLVDGELQNARMVDMSSKLPAGGFVTTVVDLARFAVAVMEHRLVTEATLEEMMTPVRLRGGEVVPYGLGWGLFPGEEWQGYREAFHGGVTPQVSGMLYLLPEADLAVAMLMNLEGVSGRTGLAAEISAVVLASRADSLQRR